MVTERVAFGRGFIPLGGKFSLNASSHFISQLSYNSHMVIRVAQSHDFKVENRAHPYERKWIDRRTEYLRTHLGQKLDFLQIGHRRIGDRSIIQALSFCHIFRGYFPFHNSLSFLHLKHPLMVVEFNCQFSLPTTKSLTPFPISLSFSRWYHWPAELIFSQIRLYA